MVFSSLPSYRHDPSNWQQQPNNTNTPTHVPPPPPPPPPPPQPHAGSIRPGSMADRARMANIPMPEPLLKCPRCDSTNTKFCYFNNYSLTQPRHFCKTCRRYWTRGGALRTVPVGGGFRRNKRSSSSSSSKSKSAAATSSNSSSSAATSSSSAPPPSLAAEILGLSPSLRFVSPAPLPHHHHHMAPGSLFLPDQYQFSGGEIMPGALGMYGLNYGSGGLESLGGFNMAEQWRIPPPQYPFPATSSGITQQMASVKMEDSSSSRVQLLLDSHNNITEQIYWNIGGGGGGDGGASSSAATTSWTDHLSGFTSSSATTNHQRL